MNIAVYLKNNFTKLPPTIGYYLNFIPFKWRPGIGTIYRKRQIEINFFEKANPNQKQKVIFEKLRNLLYYSYINIPFYKDIYKSQLFNIEDFRSFSDITKIPVINKQILNEYRIDYRSCVDKNSYVVNTGGSSGAPLSFYIHANLMGHEWAHMHTIWKKLNYSHKYLKVSFGGRSQVNNGIEYDPLRNSFSFDIYKDVASFRHRLIKYIKHYQIKYLHGYPSAIYEFANYCQYYDKELLKLIRSSLKGAFLGSEYPTPFYRKKIEEVFGIETVSWYGHTERCILAWEKYDQYTYYPFQTYGFTEAIPIEGSDKFKLVGTSYYNFVSPFIRYDTDDIIDNVVIKNGILESFTINDGRQGQFILDSYNKKIALTGLIFGRHHKLFDYCSHIQIGQSQPGYATVYYVPLPGTALPTTPNFLFDDDNVHIIFNYELLREPIKTVSGKINLNIKQPEVI